MSIVLAIIGLVFVYDLVWWRAADRMLRPLPRAARWRVPLGLFMGVNVLCVLWLVAGRIFIGGADAMTPAWVLIGTFVWHLLVLPATLIAWLLWAGGRGIGALLSRITRRTGPALPAPDSPAAPTSSRRQFIGAAVAAAPPLVTVIGTAMATEQLHQFRVRRLTLDLAQLPRDLDGMTIAHVSDIHVGRFTNGSTLSRLVDATNNLRADLVVMTGDLINMSLSDLPAGLDAVRRMEGRFGTYLIEGNHDLIEDRYEFRRRTKASGVPYLLNETTTVRVRGTDVQLLGIRWGAAAPGAPRQVDRGDGVVSAALQELLPSLRPLTEAFPILLAHHPHALDYAAAAGVPLTLSGHTHGGQLMLTDHIGFGPWMYRYWSGPYRKGDAWGVISNGVGNWFPLRVHSPAEIIKITLRRSEYAGT